MKKRLLHRFYPCATAPSFTSAACPVHHIALLELCKDFFSRHTAGKQLLQHIFCFALLCFFCCFCFGGSFFVFVLAWIYKLCYKLKQENKPEQGEELIGRKCEIYTRCQEQGQAGTEYVVYIAINGAQRELTVRSIQGKSYQEGDILTLKDYKEGIYYID